VPGSLRRRWSNG